MTIQQVLAATYGIVPPWPTEQTWDVPGTYTWIVPAGIATYAHVVCVGGAGSGQSYGPTGGGGGLGYRNNMSVSAGQSITVVVGSKGNSDNTAGGDSTFVDATVCKGGGGGAGQGYASSGGARGTYTGDGGGQGGEGGSGTTYSGNYYPAAGGAGAAGYSGNGGNGANGSTNGSYSGNSGAGGGGGGGASGWDGRSGYGNSAGGGGGGVGLFGQGSSGSGGTGAGQPGTGTSQLTNTVGGGGSGGQNGYNGFASACGGNYGGSKSNGYHAVGYCNTGNGAVRVIYDGNGYSTSRSFPSNNCHAIGDR